MYSPYVIHMLWPNREQRKIGYFFFWKQIKQHIDKDGKPIWCLHQTIVFVVIIIIMSSKLEVSKWSIVQNVNTSSECVRGQHVLVLIKQMCDI